MGGKYLHLFMYHCKYLHTMECAPFLKNWILMNHELYITLYNRNNRKQMAGLRWRQYDSTSCLLELWNNLSQRLHQWNHQYSQKTTKKTLHLILVLLKELNLDVTCNASSSPFFVQFLLPWLLILVARYETAHFLYIYSCLPFSLPELVFQKWPLFLKFQGWVLHVFRYITLKRIWHWGEQLNGLHLAFSCTMAYSASLD